MHVSDEWLNGKKPVIISSKQTLSILIDQGEETVAYPELITSGGKGASIKISYAEALFDKNGEKGNRNDIEGRTLKGNYDIFMPDGGNKRHFRPLWLRGFRYIRLDIKTGSEPLTLDDFYNAYTRLSFCGKSLIYKQRLKSYRNCGK